MSAVPPDDERFEPYEPRRRVPLPVYWIAIALAIWGTLTLWHDAHASRAAGQQRNDAAAADHRRADAPGETLFLARCSSCHQADGVGVTGAVPPLVGSPLLKSDPAVILQILLHGIAGPISVSSQHFDGHMPSFSSVLDDAQLARLATYVLARFGENGVVVTPAMVTGARARSAGRAGPWHGGAEIRARFMPSLEPQPAFVPAPLMAIDVGADAIVEHGLNGGWSCASCHGGGGQGRDNVPRLAGLPDAYIAAQLRAFAQTTRPGDAMAAVAASLDESRRISLGAYYGALATASSSRPSLSGDLARGQALALEGDGALGIPACFSCHGSSGFGVAPGFPPIAAQQSAYTAGRLAEFARQARDGSRALMPAVAARLENADRRAVADYLATLPPVPIGIAPAKEQH